MKPVLVLGGTGFIGKHVLRLLEQRGIPALSLSRRAGCDVTDLDGFTAHLREIGPRAVINCAAHVGSVHYALEHSADMIGDNTRIISNLFEGMRRACPQAVLVNPISNCSYPGDADIQTEPEWQAGPVHDTVLGYGMPRRLLYAFSACYRKQHGLRTVNWLVANAYGPGDYADPNKVHALNGIVIRLLRARREGQRTFEVWGTGTPIREWVYVEDAACILADSVDIEEQCYPLNLGQNRGHSILEIARLGARLLGYDVEIRPDPRYPDGAPKKILCDRRFRERYPDFRFTPLDEGVQRTIEYYQSVL